MNLENEIFANIKPDLQKLIKFGFVASSDTLIFNRKIPGTDFLIEIKLDSNKEINGKVLDTNFNEEYTNFRLKGPLGSFSSKIKENYCALLQEIADQYFIVSPKLTGVEWIVPANPKYFDLKKAFSLNSTIIWKQSTHIKVGDIVYSYVAAPVSALKYKCLVTYINQPFHYKDSNFKMDYVMIIRLLDTSDIAKYIFTELKKYGIKAIRGPRHVPELLSQTLSAPPLGF